MWWILDHVSSFFQIKPFVDSSTLALKSEHVRFLQDFIVWPKCLKTETTKTEKPRDRNGQTETVWPKRLRQNRPDRKAAYPNWTGLKRTLSQM